MQTTPTLREHTFHPFDTDMGRLRGGVLRMAALVERQLVRAVKAGILQSQAQAAQILAGDPAVHELHTGIDAQAGLTIARRQPAAIDLREIVAVFHIIDDLERIGQEARRIARRVQQSDASERLPGSARAEALADAVAQALRKVVDAFVNRDGLAASEQRRRAEALEIELAELAEAQQADMAESAEDLPRALSLNFILQSLGRSASHVQHFAGYVEQTFWTRGAAG